MGLYIQVDWVQANISMDDNYLFVHHPENAFNQSRYLMTLLSTMKGLLWRI